jgi:hypothetical protein
MSVNATTSSVQVDIPVHHHVIHGTTNAQRVFILAVTVAVVAGTIFSLLTLGIPQAILIGGALGLTTLVSLSEFFRVRMVKLSQLSTYKHTEWAVFPRGFIANANILRRPYKHHKPHTDGTTAVHESTSTHVHHRPSRQSQGHLEMPQ